MFFYIWTQIMFADIFGRKTILSSRTEWSKFKKNETFI